MSDDESWLYYETLRQLQVTSHEVQAGIARIEQQTRVTQLLHEIRKIMGEIHRLGQGIGYCIDVPCTCRVCTSSKDADIGWVRDYEKIREAQAYLGKMPCPNDFQRQFRVKDLINSIEG